MFDTVEGARGYILVRRQRKGYTCLDSRPTRNSSAPTVEKRPAEIPDGRSSAPTPAAITSTQSLSSVPLPRTQTLKIGPPRKATRVVYATSHEIRILKCESCGKTLETRRPERRFCDSRCCLSDWNNKHRPRHLLLEARSCESCGLGFKPTRLKARFCSVECRAAWHKAQTFRREKDGSHCTTCACRPPKD